MATERAEGRSSMAERMIRRHFHRSERSPPGIALALPFEETPETAASMLGNGERVLSCDTVPFALWCAARHLDNFEEAMWTTVAGLGDRDTTCAIAGGIVALSAGAASIPVTWLAAREPVGI